MRKPGAPEAELHRMVQRIWEMTAVYSHDWKTFTEPNIVIDRVAVAARLNSSDPATALNPFIDAPFDSAAFDETVFHTYVQQYSALEARKALRAGRCSIVGRSLQVADRQTSVQQHGA
jgi:hypothetical protein